jgi:hypothetical protein
MPVISSIGAASKTGFAPRGLPVYYSNLFVSSQTDYISMPASSNLAPGASAFTIEFFIYPNSATYQSIFSCGYISGLTGGFEIAIDGTGVPRLIKESSTYVSSVAISSGVWNYVCFSRRSTASNDSQFFINGTAATAATVTNNFSDPSLYDTTIGIRRNVLTTPANAYISNLRYRIGVGVSSAPVPTSPLTNDANTRLLTCQSATIVDNSSSPNTLTNNGVTVSTFNPF